ncbi:MAG: phosphomannomutase/phosphoglucomutase [Candidatus Altiarchaeota archaeon]
MSLFKAYDIRGIFGEELSEELARDIGRAYGTNIVTKGTVAVGRDMRESGEVLRDALIEGLTSTGLDVVDIGMVPTPVLYFSIFHLELEGGIIITASHNPPEYNGFKLCAGTSTLYGEQIQELKKAIEKGEFKKGKGKVVEKNIEEAYLDAITKGVSIKKQLKIVLDSANGTMGSLAEMLFTKLGCEVTLLFGEPDGSLPNHPADPTVDANLTDLITEVKKQKADIGIAFDGDGDRAGFVDDKGGIIRGDQALILFSRKILKEKPGSPIIFEVKCSQALYEDIKANGGEPVMYRTGHSYIKKKIKEINAPLAGEMSGHFFFADRYFGFDDGLYAAARMAEILSEKEEPLSELIKSLPKYENTPELKVSVPEEKKFGIVEKVTSDFKKRFGDKVITVDGMRLQLEDGWGLVRASNTTPVLVLRFEGRTQEKLAEIKKLILDELWKFEELADGLCELEKN